MNGRAVLTLKDDTLRDVPETTAGVLKLLQNDCFRAVADFTGRCVCLCVRVSACFVGPAGDSSLRRVWTQGCEKRGRLFD